MRGPRHAEVTRQNNKEEAHHLGHVMLKLLPGLLQFTQLQCHQPLLLRTGIRLILLTAAALAAESTLQKRQKLGCAPDCQMPMVPDIVQLMSEAGQHLCPS
jgi:hypothetical protein